MKSGVKVALKSQRCPNRGILLLLVFLVLIVGFVPRAHSQAGEQQVKAAVDAFNSGDFPKAAISLAGLITAAQGQDQTKLEPIYYMLGAANYNIPNYAAAATSLQDYIKVFPKGEHINQVSMSLALSYIKLKQGDDALKVLKTIEDVPNFHEKVLLMEATICKDNGKAADAIAPLEKLVSGNIDSTQVANGALLLAQLYLDSGNPQKASDLLTKIKKSPAKLSNVVSLNKLALALGDSYLGHEDYVSAIEAYRSIRAKQQVMDLLKQNIAEGQKSLAQNRADEQAALTQNAGNPLAASNATLQFMSLNSEIQGQIDFNNTLLDAYDKLPDPTAAIWIRMAQAYYKLNRKWEALIVYNELVDTLPQSKEAEGAAYRRIVVLVDLNMTPLALSYCESFLKTFPDSSQLPTVMYLEGSLPFRNNQYSVAEANLTKNISLIKGMSPQAQAKFRDEMDDIERLLGLAQYSSGKYDNAIQTFHQYQTDFPNGKYVEESYYRTALANLFNGSLSKAYDQFTSYIQKFPQGNVADAAYRCAYCKFSDQKYPDVLADCEKWLKDYPSNKEEGEVRALIGDTYVAMPASNPEEEAANIDKAIDSYTKSIQVTTIDKTLGYSISAASGLLEKKSDWPTLAKMWQDYVKNHPTGDKLLEGILAISKALSHEGKSIEAKQFLVDTITKNVQDPSKDAVDSMLDQLAQLCVKARPPAPPDAASGGSSATPAPGSPPVAVAPVVPGDNTIKRIPTQATYGFQEMEGLLKPIDAMASPTARARVLYAKSELCRMRRDLTEQEAYLKQIADGFKPGDMSPALLGKVGDYAFSQNRLDVAEACYQELITGYPMSNMTDYGYVGMGNIALGKKNYDAAEKDFDDSMEKVTASQKLKDALIGKGKALLELNHPDDAQKLFEQVASNRDWHGEVTAESLYYMGEIQQRSNKLPEAIAFYQRVYLAYQRYPTWVVKSYLQSGDSFEKLGKKEEAINTYKEMLNNPKLKNFTNEMDQAKQRLNKLGVQS